MEVNLKKRIFHSAIWSLGSRIIAQGITFVTMIYLAKLLGISDFGAINFGVLIVGLVDSIVDFGFLSAIIKEKNITEEQLSSCFWFISIISIFGILIISLYSTYIIIDDSYSSVIDILVYGLLFVPFQSVTRALVARDLKLDSIAKFELIGGLIRNGAALFGAYYGYGVKGFIYGFLCERIFVSICLGVSTFWLPRLIFNLSALHSFIKFGIASTSSRIIWYLSTKIDSFFIGLYFGKEALGLYSLAMQIANMPFQLVTTGVHRVIYATFSKFVDRDNFVSVIKRTAWLVLVFSAPACIGIFAVADVIIEIFFDEKWSQSAQIIKWLSISSLVQIYSSTWPQFWNAIGKPGYGVIVNLINFIVFSFILYLIGVYGDFEDIKMAVLFISFIRLFVVCILSKKLIDISFFRVLYESMFPIIGCLLIILWCNNLILYFDLTNNISKLSLMIAGGAVTYMAFIGLAAMPYFLPVKKLLSK